jgi:hypothetical protein
MRISSHAVERTRLSVEIRTFRLSGGLFGRTVPRRPRALPIHHTRDTVMYISITDILAAITTLVVAVIGVFLLLIKFFNWRRRSGSDGR